MHVLVIVSLRNYSFTALFAKFLRILLFIELVGFEIKHEGLGLKSFIHSDRQDSTFYSFFAFKN